MHNEESGHLVLGGIGMNVSLGVCMASFSVDWLEWEWMGAWVETGRSLRESG